MRKLPFLFGMLLSSGALVSVTGCGGGSLAQEPVSSGPRPTSQFPTAEPPGRLATTCMLNRAPIVVRIGIHKLHMLVERFRLVCRTLIQI